MTTISYNHELAAMAKSPNHAESKVQDKKEHDTQVLARLGKKSVLEVQENPPARPGLKLTEESVGLGLYR